MNSPPTGAVKAALYYIDIDKIDTDNPSAAGAGRHS